MPLAETTAPALGTHGAARLPAVEVVSYNLELTEKGEFVGDRASKKSFQAILEKWRKPLRKLGDDPFGETPSDGIGRKELDAALGGDETRAAGLVHGVVEDFAQALAYVIARFLKVKSWADCERIAMGGGMSDNKIGRLAVGRAEVLLKSDKINIDLVPIRNDPDDAGLIGAVQLAPRWVFEGHDSILAVDIGGTNMRAGVIRLGLEKAPDLSKAKLWKREIWHHAADNPNRDEAVGELAGMLEKLIRKATKAELRLAPFIGIGCPGIIDPDGDIDRGAQNLPGNWESSRFNLPAALVQAIPTIGAHDTVVVMHNDAVVQGLSEVPYMSDVSRWAALTMGTGLGNACFVNRAPAGEE